MQINLEVGKRNRKNPVSQFINMIKIPKAKISATAMPTSNFL